MTTVVTHFKTILLLLLQLVFGCLFWSLRCCVVRNYPCRRARGTRSPSSSSSGPSQRARQSQRGSTHPAGWTSCGTGRWEYNLCFVVVVCCVGSCWVVFLLRSFLSGLTLLLCIACRQASGACMSICGCAVYVLSLLHAVCTVVHQPSIRLLERQKHDMKWHQMTSNHIKIK